MKLNDSYVISGQDLASFKACVSSVAASTKDVKIPGSEVVLLSPCMSKKMQKDGEFPFYVLSPAYRADFEESGKLHLGYKKISEIGEETANALRTTGGFLLMFQGNTYSVSRMAFQTLTQRAGVNGDELIKHNSLARDMLFAECLQERNEKIRFVYREEVTPEGIVLKKIFAAFGSMFAPSPQTILTETIDALKLGRVKNWSCTHEETRITLNVGVKQNYPCGSHFLTPAIALMASDIGRGRTGIQTEIWVDGKLAFIVGQKSFVHKSEITSSAMIEFAREMIDSLLEETERLAVMMPHKAIYDEMGILKNIVSISSLSGKRAALVKDLLESGQMTFVSSLDDLMSKVSAYPVEKVITAGSITEWYTNLYLVTKTLIGDLDVDCEIDFGEGA